MNSPNNAQSNPSPVWVERRARAPLTEAQQKSRADDERIEREAAESAERIFRAHTDYLSEISHLPGNKKPCRPERSAAL